MTLLLQPVFVDLNNSNEAFSTQQRHPDHENVGGRVLTSETTEDSLCSMWKVATKVKSMMAEGERFENLTWRAWHRKNQLERAERERKENEVTVEELSLHSVELSKLSELSLRSQATAIPSRLTAKSSTTYNQGYSSILLEIQQASARASGHSPKPITMPNRLSSLKANAPIGRGEIVNTTSLESTAESTTSNSSVKTNKIQSSRRRKKNVDKFIKLQQLGSLERISEQSEDLTSAPLEALDIAMHHGSSVNTQAESSSLNETSSICSAGDLTLRRPPPPPQLDNDGEYMFRRSEQPARKHASPPHSDRPNVSLLTMLLHRETKRPESCPPPEFGASPPVRPGAPVSIGHVDSSSCTTLDESSHENLPSPLATTSSPPRLTTAKSTPPGDHSLEGSSNGSSSQSAGNRRRGLPNPSDYTTPLYIW